MNPIETSSDQTACDICGRLFEKKWSMLAHRTHHFKDADFYKNRLGAGRKQGCKIADTTNYKKPKSPEHREKLAQHMRSVRSDWGVTMQGRFGDHLRGKTYVEIYGSEEKAVARAAITSCWMKSDKNIRRFCTKPSKPQLALFEKVLKEYPGAVLEYPLRISGNKTIWLDVAVVDLKIDYEYDGAYWHQDKNKDILRDAALKELGWTVIRFTE
jgi:hypothetical protein